MRISLSTMRTSRLPSRSPARRNKRPLCACKLSCRRAKAREQAALAAATAAREAVLDRLQWQIAELRVNLDKIAVANAVMAAELN
jgi:hypothetical protein